MALTVALLASSKSIWTMLSLETLPKSAGADQMGKVLAGGWLVGGGRVSRRRSGCTRGVGGHGGGHKRGFPLVVYVL